METICSMPMDLCPLEAPASWKIAAGAPSRYCMATRVIGEVAEPVNASLSSVVCWHQAYRKAGKRGWRSLHGMAASTGS
jgi:hypothetical protein